MHDELLDLCAGQMQLVAMQQERLQALAGLLKDWELIVGEHTEISRRTQTILNDVEGLMSAQFDLGVKEGKSIAPKKGAEKKHQKNRAIKADVFAWLDSNMSRFKSMDQAAEAIAGKVAHIAFRTARAWVGEWKKLRSASKA